MRDFFAHGRVRRHLEARFLGATPDGAAGVREHLETCAACRSHFDRLAAADRAVAGDPDEPGPFERAFARDCAMDRATGTARANRPIRVALTFVALATAASAAVVLHRPNEDAPEAPVFRPRGPAPALHDVEFLCFDPRTRAVASAPAPSAALRCPEASELQIAAMNTAGAEPPLPYLTLVSVAADGTANRLLPRDAEPGTLSMRLGELPRMTALGAGLRLSVNHPPGRYRVYGLFTNEAVRPEALDAHLEGKAPGVRVERTLEVTQSQP
jgi:hypothetical protein